MERFNERIYFSARNKGTQWRGKCYDSVGSTCVSFLPTENLNEVQSKSRTMLLLYQNLKWVPIALFLGITFKARHESQSVFPISFPVATLVSRQLLPRPLHGREARDFPPICQVKATSCRAAYVVAWTCCPSFSCSRPLAKLLAERKLGGSSRRADLTDTGCL